jgi:hypothetical protein
MKPATLQAIQAFRSPAMPSNPRPFAAALSDVLADGHAITSPEARAVLWVLMCQSFGQMARIDLDAMWDTLNEKVQP